MYYLPQFLQLARGVTPLNSAIILLSFLVPIGKFFFAVSICTSDLIDLSFCSILCDAFWFYHSTYRTLQIPNRRRPRWLDCGAGTHGNCWPAHSNGPDFWLSSRGWRFLWICVPKVGVLLYSQLSNNSPYYDSSLLAAQAAVPRHEVAVVTGVRNFVRLLGATLVLAVAGIISDVCFEILVQTDTSARVGRKQYSSICIERAGTFRARSCIYPR